MVVKIQNYQMQEPSAFSTDWVTVGTALVRQVTITWDRYAMASFKNVLARVFQNSPPSYTLNYLEPVSGVLADVNLKPFSISAPVLSEAADGSQILGPVVLVSRP